MQIQPTYSGAEIKGEHQCGFHQLGELGGVEFPHGKTKLEDGFVKREIDEAISNVIERFVRT